MVQVVVARVMGERPLCGRNNVKHSMKQQKDVHMHVMVHVFQFVLWYHIWYHNTPVYTHTCPRIPPGSFPSIVGSFRFLI